MIDGSTFRRSPSGWQKRARQMPRTGSSLSTPTVTRRPSSNSATKSKNAALRRSHSARWRAVSWIGIVPVMPRPRGLPSTRLGCSSLLRHLRYARALGLCDLAVDMFEFVCPDFVIAVLLLVGGLSWKRQVPSHQPLDLVGFAAKPDALADVDDVLGLAAVRTSAALSVGYQCKNCLVVAGHGFSFCCLMPSM